MRRKLLCSVMTLVLLATVSSLPAQTEPETPKARLKALNDAFDAALFAWRQEQVEIRNKARAEAEKAIAEAKRLVEELEAR